MKGTKSTDKSYTQPTHSISPDKKSITQNFLTQTKISEMSQEEFEAKIMDIDLKKPRSAYSYYITDIKNKEKDKTKSIIDICKEYAKNWPKLNSKEREKYEKMAIDDKARYNEHTLLVKKFIVAKPLKESATAYDIFIDYFISEAIENGQNPKEARKEALMKWRDMPSNEKNKYKDKMEHHRELFENLRKAKSSQINAYALFCKDKMIRARDTGKTMTFKECSEA
jgi:hypothetical protein